MFSRGSFVEESLRISHSLGKTYSFIIGVNAWAWRLISLFRFGVPRTIHADLLPSSPLLLNVYNASFIVFELHWRSLDEPDRNFVLERAVVGEVFTTDTSNGVWEGKNKLDSLTSAFWIHMEVAAHNAFKGTFLLLRMATSIPDCGNSHNQGKRRSKAFSCGRKPLWLHPPALIT
jgi:hypothetical protein